MDFKYALESLIRNHLRNGGYPHNVLTDLKEVTVDIEGLSKYAGDWYEGLPNQKPDAHKRPRI